MDAQVAPDAPGVAVERMGTIYGLDERVTGYMSGALDANQLVVGIAPLAIVLWIRWALRSWRGESPRVTYGQFRRRNLVMVACLIAVLVFGVIRNFVPYLGSGIG